MTFDKDKFLDKCRKVLGLTKSPNEHEAARAMERLQAMLAEHNLTMADVATESKSTDEVKINDLDELYESVPWMRVLATPVAKLYFCRALFNHVYKDRPGTTKTGVHRKNSGMPVAYKRMDKFSFVGAPHNAAVAVLMFAYLVETINRLSREGAKAVPVKQRSKYRTTFRNMCAWRLCQRIEQRIADTKAGKVKTEGGTNLPAVIYDQLEKPVNDFMDQMFGDNLKTKAVALSAKHGQGYQDGIKAGDSISLDGQVGEKKRGRIEGSSLITADLDDDTLLTLAKMAGLDDVSDLDDIWDGELDIDQKTRIVASLKSIGHTRWKRDGGMTYVV